MFIKYVNLMNLVIVIVIAIVILNLPLMIILWGACIILYERFLKDINYLNLKFEIELIKSIYI